MDAKAKRKLERVVGHVFTAAPRPYLIAAEGRGQPNHLLLQRGSNTAASLIFGDTKGQHLGLAQRLAIFGNAGTVAFGPDLLNNEAQKSHGAVS